MYATLPALGHHCYATELEDMHFHAHSTARGKGQHSLSLSYLDWSHWTGPQSIQSNFFFFIKPFFFLFYHRFPRKIGHIFYPECNYINEISIDSVAIISCNYCPLRPILFVVYEKFIRLPSQFYSPARLMVSTFFASLPKSTVLSGWVTCLLKSFKFLVSSCKLGTMTSNIDSSSCQRAKQPTLPFISSQRLCFLCSF